MRVEIDEHWCILSSALSLLTGVAKRAEEAFFELLEGILEERRQVVDALRAVLCQANEEVLEDDRVLILRDLAAQLFSLNRRCEEHWLSAKRFKKGPKLFHILRIEAGEEVGYQILDESVKLNLEDGICLILLKVQNLFASLVEHHRGYARVVLHKKSQLFESVLV